MVQSIDDIKQSQNNNTNNITRMAQMMKQVLAENQDLASGIAMLTGIQKKALTKIWEDDNSNGSKNTEKPGKAELCQAQ